MHCAKRTFVTSSRCLQQAMLKEESFVSRLPASYPIKSTKLPNGLLVVSLDNNSPLSRVCAIFKAGSRVESSENEGIVHQVRNCLGTPSIKYSGITISHETASFGGLLECTTNRDFLSYNVTAPRDAIFGAMESSISEIVCQPKFRMFLLENSHHAMRIDHAAIREDFPSYSIDLLHKAAYRQSPLSRSLYASNRMIGKHTENMLYDYFERYVTSNNGALVGLGVDHELLLKYAAEMFLLPQSSAESAIHSAEKSKYGGGEMRKERGGEITVVALAVEGASLEDPKIQATQTLLLNAIGSSPRMKWNSGGESRLNRAIKSSITNPFYISPINLNYTDSGLCGVQYVCQAADSEHLAKSVIGEFRKAAREGLQEKDLQAAKAKTNFQVLSALDDNAISLDDLAVQSFVRGTYLSNSDIVKLVDGISLGEVNQMAKKIFASKLSMVAIGNLDKTPYLDELSKL
uniref:Uncharacterized protein n=1 Tax=Romanomermis culicivorax TaxID=13658 RepID=A0A915HFK9_ROMCU